MTAYDVAELRGHFPALSLTQDDRPRAFFDGPGGTQVPQEVIDAVVAYYRESNANDGGSFVTSHRSDAIVRAARAALVDFLNARSVHEIKFGPNMTTLTFHASRSIGASLSPGDEVLLTVLDHEANVSPWQLMAADRGAIVRTIDIREEDGTLDLDDFDRKLSNRTSSSRSAMRRTRSGRSTRSSTWSAGPTRSGPSRSWTRCTTRPMA
jgi:selenocysteine lyase/cysteine desulfurase